MLSFPWLFSLSNNSFLGIFLSGSISFCTILELHPLSRRNLPNHYSVYQKSLFITLSIRDTATSKKLIEVFDHSSVTFMVGCTLSILSMNDVNLSSPCSHKKNMLSVYHHHKYGLYSDSYIIPSSCSAINKMLYGGASLVPIAVPVFG